MKFAPIMLLIAFASPTLAQTGNDQRITLVSCSSGSGSDLTTVTIETGGLTGTQIFGRVDHGTFHSGDIIVELFKGIEIPEDKTYLDVETLGKKFSLTYDFINRGQLGTLILNNDSRSAPSTNQLICNP